MKTSKEKVTLAEHVAETHREKERSGNVVTGDIVSGDVVEKEEEAQENDAPEKTEGGGS